MPNPTKRKLSKENLDGRLEVGVSGLKHSLGDIEEEFLRAFKHDRKWRTLQEMRDNDPIVGAILFAVEMLIRQVSWRVKPSNNSNEALELAEFVESCRLDMSHSWENFIVEILSFLTYGFSYHEIIYKRRNGLYTSGPQSAFTDGKIGWRKLPIRAQNTLDSWDLDSSGGVQAFIQEDPNTFKLYTIPITKALHFRTTTHKNNPEGRSVLRNAYRPWYFKKRVEMFEGIGIERDLAGLPVMYVPNQILSAKANNDEKATLDSLKNILVNIKRDAQEGVILPGDMQDGKRLYSFELMSSGGSRQFNTNDIVARHDQRIAMTVLADFIMLGHEKTGSFALSSSKTDFFAMALGAWMDEITSVFNKHAITRLLQINGLPQKNAPVLTHGDIESPDLAVLGEYVSKLSSAGVQMFPDAEVENVLRAAANLPLREREER